MGFTEEKSFMLLIPSCLHVVLFIIKELRGDKRRGSHAIQLLIFPLTPYHLLYDYTFLAKSLQ